MPRLLLCAILLTQYPASAMAQPAEHGWEVLYDPQVTLRMKDARFTAGTRQLSWKDPGREHLEFREEKSTTYKDGIVTYVPVASLARIEYDHDKKLVRVSVKQTGGKARPASSVLTSSASKARPTRRRSASAARCSSRTG
ncbi:MAG: hypothetical protein L0Y71_08835 [Gemmataceae bacterium]|nr:hypothetical protein [Gemmataceae bacterium]